MVPSVHYPLHQFRTLGHMTFHDIYEHFLNGKEHTVLNYSTLRLANLSTLIEFAKFIRNLIIKVLFYCGFGLSHFLLMKEMSCKYDLIKNSQAVKKVRPPKRPW